ncbi:transposase [Hymenobacter baengnokdamensis]|uniref:transposase n=1 Tax=Hymenobacter baengnokdamensis TaxID=2615203 RepID=UPI00124867F6|nr:transposase [Hymenobacter baengnokdamensis]
MPDLIQYERRLPHRLPPGKAVFLTFRLAGSLPRQLLAQWREEDELKRNRLELSPDQRYEAQKRYFGRFDVQLARADCGPVWLAQPEVAALVRQSLHYLDGKGYDLLGYCLMPNHVHLVAVLPIGAPALVKTLQRLKGYTATQANKLLGRTGAFWQAESYDHVVRQGELARIMAYVAENPVKAGLVTDWQQWPYTYVTPL